MSKFHITITDNETNEILHEADTGAIIGAYALDDGAYSVAKIACDGLTLLTTIESAKTAIEHCMEDIPVMKLLSKLYDRVKKNHETDDDDTDN